MGGGTRIMGRYTNYIDNIGGKSVLTFEIDKNKYFLGVPECYYIWVNTQNDTYVIYDDEIYNESDIMDSLWYDFSERTGSTDEDAFDDYLEKIANGNYDEVYNALYDLNPCGKIIDEYYTGTWGKAVLGYEYY